MKHFSLLFVSSLIVVVCALFTSPASSSAVELPRHVSETASNEELCHVLFKKAPVVAVIVNSLTNPSDQEVALLESYAKAAMSFVGDEGVKFVALASDTTTTTTIANTALDAGGSADAPKVSPLVRSWVIRSSPVHRKTGIPNGVFIFRRKNGKQADMLWRDWANETDEIDVPLDVLPVELDEIILAPSLETNAERIVRRVRCMKGPNVRELRTEADLEDFVLNTCHPNGLSLVAWPRRALFPTAQRVPRAKLAMLRHTQQALATVAQLERRHLSFGWVDDDAPLIENTTLLAIANGMNAPIIAYVCGDGKCQASRDPFNMRDLHIRLYPFQPFEVLRDVPETQLGEVMQIAVSEYLAEVVEAVEKLPSTGSFEYGFNLKDFPREVDEEKIAELKEKHEETRKKFQTDMDKFFEQEQQKRKQKQTNKKDKQVQEQLHHRRQIPPTPRDTIVHMSTCNDPVRSGESVRLLIFGDALSFDPVDSRPVVQAFYTSPDLVKGDLIQIGHSKEEEEEREQEEEEQEQRRSDSRHFSVAKGRNSFNQRGARKNKKKRSSLLFRKDLPPQFNLLSDEIFADKLCRDPPTRATIIIRANRHYNVSDLPPNVYPQSTLKFYIEVLPRSGVTAKNTDVQDDAENDHDDDVDDDEGAFDGSSSSHQQNEEEIEKIVQKRRQEFASSAKAGFDEEEEEDEQQQQQPPNERINGNNNNKFKPLRSGSAPKDYMNDPRFNFVMTNEDIKAGRVPDVEIPESEKKKNKKNR